MLKMAIAYNKPCGSAQEPSSHLLFRKSWDRISARDTSLRIWAVSCPISYSTAGSGIKTNLPFRKSWDRILAGGTSLRIRAVSCPISYSTVGTQQQHRLLSLLDNKSGTAQGQRTNLRFRQSWDQMSEISESVLFLGQSVTVLLEIARTLNNYLFIAWQQ